MWDGFLSKLRRQLFLMILLILPSCAQEEGGATGETVSVVPWATLRSSEPISRVYLDATGTGAVIESYVLKGAYLLPEIHAGDRLLDSCVAVPLLAAESVDHQPGAVVDKYMRTYAEEFPHRRLNSAHNTLPPVSFSYEDGARVQFDRDSSFSMRNVARHPGDLVAVFEGGERKLTTGNSGSADVYSLQYDPIRGRVLICWAGGPTILVDVFKEESEVSLIESRRNLRSVDTYSYQFMSGADYLVRTTYRKPFVHDDHGLASDVVALDLCNLHGEPVATIKNDFTERLEFLWVYAASSIVATVSGSKVEFYSIEVNVSTE